MSPEQVVETWLAELAVASRHQARRERANVRASTAVSREPGRETLKSEPPAEAAQAA